MRSVLLVGLAVPATMSAALPAAMPAVLVPEQVERAHSDDQKDNEPVFRKPVHDGSFLV